MKTRSVNGKTVIQGAAIGGLCGLLASAAMNVVPPVWSWLDDDSSQSSGDDATVKTAEALAEPVLHRQLTGDEKNTGGPVVHFAFGTAIGAIYGALAPLAPVLTVGFGVAYATAVWLIGDELLVPKLGLAPAPGKTSAKTHVKSWLMHATYGLILETGRTLVHKRLG